MRWLQIHAEVSTADVALTETLLEHLGASGITLNDAGDVPILEPLPGETPLWPQVIVTGLFTEEADMTAVTAFLSSQLPAATRIWHDWLQDQQWERAWMDHYQPIACGQRLWIVPEWQTPPMADAINLMLDPGLAFGTGDHASTFLCMQWLDQQDLAGKTVIDYGCGSGILGVAALLLGARQVYACDIDPQAVLATRQNAERNQVADRLQVALPFEFEPMLQADLPSMQVTVIVANILARPLMQLANRFAGWLQPGGTIVLAGLTLDQIDDVREAYAPWFDLSQMQTRDQDWCRLSGHRLTAVAMQDTTTASD